MNYVNNDISRPGRNISSNVSDESRIFYLVCFASVKPLLLWSSLHSLAILVVLVNNEQVTLLGLLQKLLILFISSFFGIATFLMVILSRTMCITSELYLTASFPLFHDISIIIPRYILWELIFTSRWVWLSIHLIAASTSCTKVWNILTFHNSTPSPYITSLFLTTGVLSFLRFFGKNQNTFSWLLQLSNINIRHVSCHYNYTPKSLVSSIHYFLQSGKSGNFNVAFALSFFSFLVSAPICIIGFSIPGLTQLFKFMQSMPLNILLDWFFDKGNPKSEYYSLTAAAITVTCFWYCIELHYNSIQNCLSLNLGINKYNLTQKLDEYSLLVDQFSSALICAQCVKLIRNQPYKLFTKCSQSAEIFILKYLNTAILTILLIPLYLPFWIIPKIRHYTGLVISNYFYSTCDTPISVLASPKLWSSYERKSLFVINHLRRQIDYIFSILILLDPCIPTKIASSNNNEINIIIQTYLGIDNTHPLKKFDTNTWFMQFLDPRIKKHFVASSFIPSKISEWWHNNILLTEDSHTPTSESKSLIISSIMKEYDTSLSLKLHRNDIFLNILKKFYTSYNTEFANVSEDFYTSKVDSNIVKDRNGSCRNSMSQLIFLMQEMTLNTINLCIIHLYGYHRWLIRLKLTNSFNDNVSAYTLKLFLSEVIYLKNCITVIQEIGVLKSQHLHPMFINSILRIYKECDDTIHLVKKYYSEEVSNLQLPFDFFNF
ncbi:hypothetical protein ACR3K2_14220 [Cryptosporidium serpentis]